MSNLPGIKLPNIRRLFVPDPGKLICDCDLSGADAQVVAWETNDEKLKYAFRNGLNVHNENGKDMWGESYDPKKMTRGTMTMRDQIKRATHGTNYGATPRTLAITLGWKINEAERFQKQWFELHPNIQSWHGEVQYSLQTKRSVSNKFGYRIIYFDRIAALLPTALAWIPQSTIAINCSLGAINLSKIPGIELLLQVHDSVVFQLPFNQLNSAKLKEIKSALSVTIPYSDPLVVPWEIAVSEKNWGDVTKIKWSDNA